MPAVLVHGVPETPAIWDQLRTHLRRDDVVALQLPGFGCPRPDGFGSTKEEYVSWLTDQVAALRSDGPVDLVGHDWGGGLVLRLVSLRADLVRSWATDAAGLGDIDFEWHEFAKIWQTPGAGEDFFAQQLAVPADRRSGFKALDQTMADSILALYRSAVDVGREWGPDFRDIPAPGLVIVPAQDPFLNEDSARRAAASSGAEINVLPDAGHWWLNEDPATGAAMLEEFWAQIG